MARILLYTDLTPSWPWVFATIHANRDMLAEHDIVLGPFAHWLCELVPSQLLMWKAVSENEAPPPHMVKWLEEVAVHIDAGRDVLLMTHIPNLMGQQSLARLIRRYIDLKKHTVQSFFSVGRPLCAFEQRYMESLYLLSDGEGRICGEVYSSISSLIKDAYDEWGRNNVAVLTDFSDSPVAKTCNDVSIGFFAKMGCPAPTPPSSVPVHPLFLASQEGRRLAWTLQVRGNGWPQVDAGLFMDCLMRTEISWSTAPLSPKKLRQSLIENGAADLRALEELIGLEAGSLDCPPWLATQAEAQFVTQLPDLNAEAFAAALPSSVANPLRQRYVNDSLLLSEDQKIFASALSSVSNEYNVIGEQTPPIELTVLTMTYNHSAYIAECMDSVLAQRTDFPVRHIVLDHCSSDGTAEIVADYAAKHASVRPVLLSHRMPSENVMGLFIRCSSRYAALCDGDDYFLDPLKLQKQVDFLEASPQCSLCFHPVSVRYEGEPSRSDIYPPLSMMPRGIRKEYYLADLLQGNLIQTNSVVYRWRFQDGVPDWFRPDICPGDWYWHLLHAELGKVGFLPEVMSVYRRHKTALYYASTVSSLENRRLHGMSELETYQVVNEHFKNRYFVRLASLANGVFANFLEIYVESGDTSLLDQACKAFPEFGKHFLNSLRIAHIKND